MWESFMAWLRSLFAPSSAGAKLENLNTTALNDKIRLLDIEKERVISRTEKLKADRERLRLEARKQDELRKREIAKQIVGLDEEISDKEEQLDQIYQQRKMLRQLIRYSERMDRMREYGLEKIFGPDVDLASIEKDIMDATMGGSLDMERLTRVTSSIDSALAYGRATVTDEAVLSVLEEIARDEDTEKVIDELTFSPEKPRPVEDPEITRILRELEEQAPDAQAEQKQPPDAQAAEQKQPPEEQPEQKQAQTAPKPTAADSAAQPPQREVE